MIKLDDIPTPVIIIIVLILFGFGIYIEFFKCGNINGTMADMPRYCWWFK